LRARLISKFFHVLASSYATRLNLFSHALATDCFAVENSPIKSFRKSIAPAYPLSTVHPSQRDHLSASLPASSLIRDEAPPVPPPLPHLFHPEPASPSPQHRELQVLLRQAKPLRGPVWRRPLGWHLSAPHLPRVESRACRVDMSSCLCLLLPMTSVRRRRRRCGVGGTAAAAAAAVTAAAAAVAAAVVVAAAAVMATVAVAVAQQLQLGWGSAGAPG
jgi:hypothetical protein